MKETCLKTMNFYDAVCDMLFWYNQFEGEWKFSINMVLQTLWTNFELNHKNL